MTEIPRRRRRRTRLGRATWGLFLALELPLIVGVLAGLGAGYLHPRLFWWAQLCAALLPYLALLLAAAAAGALLAGRRGWLAFHAVLLGFVVLRVMPADLFRTMPEAAPGDLVLMTFNVPQSGPSAEALGDSMVALVRARRPDLLAMQESWVRGPRRSTPAREAVQVRSVLGALPYDVVVPPGLQAERGAEIHVPVLARRGAVEVLEVTAIDTGDPRDAEASRALRVRFRWGGREALLYNLHLRSYGAEKPWQDPTVDLLAPRTWVPYLRRYRAAYRARAMEVETLTGHLHGEGLPVVVVGDLNEAPYSWAYRRLQGAGARSGRRIDAFRAAGRGDGRTYHGRQPVVRIDYVLADPAFEVVAAEVPATVFSDHRPVLVRLRWRDRPAD